MDSDALLTSAEVAKRLGVSSETVHKMCRTGKWPHAKIGRFYRFTQDQFETIITPPVPKKEPRTQRQKIDKLLRAI